MTNEEKVLAVWPDAREVQLRRGKWLIAHGNDPERPGYSILGPEFASIEAAWQNAAESLPARAKDSRCACKAPRSYAGSDETICANCGGSHPFPAITLREPVAPVGAKEKEPEEVGFHCRWCSKPVFQNGDGVWYHRATVRTHCDRVAEPKPTPSTIANVRNGSIFSEMVGGPQLEPQPDSSSIPDKVAENCNCWHVSKHSGRRFAGDHFPDCPARDSSSISTEQTFEQWWQTVTDSSVYYSLEELARLAWNAAKGQSNGR